LKAKVCVQLKNIISFETFLTVLIHLSDNCKLCINNNSLAKLGIKKLLNVEGTVRKALKEQSSALEEGKADVLGFIR
jgi:hypothetical protein